MKAPVIIDTDFGFFYPDGLAALTAFGTPEIDVLGICVIAGDQYLRQEVEDALRFLELIGRSDVPVCLGFDRPLVHERDADESRWGLWGTDGPVRPRAGRLAATHPSSTHASDFIIEQAHARPGEVTLLTLGPLTNVAVALRKDPTLARTLKRIVSMGGTINKLPRGEGAHTTTTEFNFWVDAEAASIVMRSGADVTLVPMNAARQMKLTRDVVARASTGDSNGARLCRDHLVPLVEELGLGMEHYALADVTAFTYVVAPDLFRTQRLFVDVDITHGLGYGTVHAYTIGSTDKAAEAGESWAWTGLPQPHHLVRNRAAPQITIAYEIDAPAAIERFVTAVHAAPGL